MKTTPREFREILLNNNPSQWERLIAARDAAANPLDEDTPRDELLLVYAPSRDGWPPIFSLCQWHPDAGFCIDEVREPDRWWRLPTVTE